jgi:hypothetical protein
MLLLWDDLLLLLLLLALWSRGRMTMREEEIMVVVRCLVT